MTPPWIAATLVPLRLMPPPYLATSHALLLYPVGPSHRSTASIRHHPPPVISNNSHHQIHNIT
jgi:hypothetical protein